MALRGLFVENHGTLVTASSIKDVYAFAQRVNPELLCTEWVCKEAILQPFGNPFVVPGKSVLRIPTPQEIKSLPTTIRSTIDDVYEDSNGRVIFTKLEGVKRNQALNLVGYPQIVSRIYRIAD